MAAGRYDTIIEQGATFERVFNWKDSTGAGINLTGYTVAGKVKAKTSDKVQLLSFTVTIADQTLYAGKFTASLSATQTAGLPAKYTSDGRKEDLNLYYDIEANTGPTVYRIVEGILSGSPEVTK